MKKYDVIVIGSGGGAKIVSPAAKMGLKVACIEQAALGGTCLNRGCIPSKMVIRPADVLRLIEDAGRYGIHGLPRPTLDLEALVTQVSQVVDGDSSSIVAGYERNPNIDLYRVPGRFCSPNVVVAGGDHLTADKIFIAVGSRPSLPNIPGLKDTPYMTSTEALRNTVLPKRMIVLGGGYIACELGHAYAAFGSEVHFLVRSVLLRREDAQVREEFLRVFSRHHHVHQGATVTQVEHRGGLFRVTYRDADGQESRLTAEALLVATGVTPNTDTLGLNEAGIAVDPNGYIITNDRLETSVPGVYAFGDCIGRYFFRHSVNFEGEYLMRTKFETPSDEPIRYPPVPHAVFTHPQVASVGATEDELRASGADYVVGYNPYKSSAMGMALRSDSGFVKILIARGSKKILGAHIIGDEASDMIHTVIALMTKDGTLDDLLNMIYIHPALPEILRNAARKAKAELEKG